MHKKDINNFIATKLNTLSIQPVSVADKSVADKSVADKSVADKSVADENHHKDYQQVLSGQYSEDSQAITDYLTTLRRPKSLSRSKFRRFRLRASKF
jgi:hypothetical protein